MEKTITQFLDKEYKEYSFYTIENRAIPSVIDSFKPVQRKIVFVSEKLRKNINEKKKKVFQLAGSVASDAFYHHGDQSLQDAIISMSQTFKNNLPILNGYGIIGSLRTPKSGAPRYVEARLSQNFRMLYKDFELLDYKEEEGNKIEPKYYLPIIPMVLINGSSGVAVGHASNILNRDPINIIDACVSVLNKKPIKNIVPYIDEFKGSWIQDAENHKKWIIRGSYQRMNTSTVRVTELPTSITYESYEKYLDKLCEDKLIVSYDDNCKDNIEYVIKFTREDLAKLDDEKLVKLLKIEQYETENFTTIDENGKLKIFDSAEDIIRYFVDFRLEYYVKRKEYNLNKLKDELNVLANKGKFIKAILDEKIEVRNKKKDALINDIDAFGISKIEDSYDYLLRMPIWSLTKELYEKLKEDFINKKKEIDGLSKVEPITMYLDDLSELKKKLKK